MDKVYEAICNKCGSKRLGVSVMVTAAYGYRPIKVAYENGETDLYEFGKLDASDLYIKDWEHSDGYVCMDCGNHGYNLSDFTKEGEELEC